MEQLIPRTLKRWESYQSSLAKSAVFTQFQTMTKGQLSLTIKDDPIPYSFGYGNKVKARIHIENERFFNRFWNNGELGFGESYVEGDWNSPDLAQVIRWFFLNVEQIEAFVRPEDMRNPLMQFMLGMRYIQDVIDHSRSLEKPKTWASYYDLERPFFAHMLDGSLINSGAIFLKGDTLADAQARKMRRLARELCIKPGHHILELGCGWGAFAVFLAEHYDCRVTAVTIADEQFEFLEDQIIKKGLSEKITAQHADYRAVEGRFDRIVSVELIDKLQPTELEEFFTLCDTWLKPQGIMVHQLLLTPESFRTDSPLINEWNQKYISPGIATPSLSQVLAAMSARSSFCIRNLKDIGISYTKTLEAWTQNFEKNREAVAALGFEDRFLRSWHYYLSYAEAAFDHGLLTAAQISFSRATQRGEEKGHFHK